MERPTAKTSQQKVMTFFGLSYGDSGKCSEKKKKVLKTTNRELISL